MPPIGSSVITISLGPPIISGSIIPWAVVVARTVSRAVIGGAGNDYGNMVCLCFTHRQKSPDKNNREN
jgi:hypothetical protein